MFNDCQLEYVLDTGEAVYHYSDYASIMSPDHKDVLTERGWIGDYLITDSGVLRMADVKIGCFSLFILLDYWSLLRASYDISCPDSWLGSTPAKFFRLEQYACRLIPPSKVRRLLLPLAKNDGPSKLAASHVLSDLDTWPRDLIYDLENDRYRKREHGFWDIM